MSDSDIEREILLAVVAGEASELEHRLVRARRQADPTFDREVEQIEWLWSSVRADTGILHESAPPSPESIIAAAGSSATRRGRPRADGRRTRSTRKSWLAGAVAASVLMVVGLGVLRSEPPGDGEYSPRVVVTGVDESVSVALEDGTVVRLAPNSRLEFGQGSGRTVDLTGRAFFAVARRDGDPFKVRLPQRTITVLGTRFDVEGRDGRTRVAVVEGEVRISGDGPELTARRDQVAYGADSGALVIQRVDDIYATIDWLGGFLAFETTPLAEVAEEIRDRFGLRIAIADSVLSARTMTGWFTDQTPGGMIAAICTAVGAVCTIDGRDVRMDLPYGPDSASLLAAEPGI
jgi:ferric-dicitrate binding protein FerR (iron transport regulator)